MKNVLVIGAGISGLGAAHVLLRHECNVIVSDLKDNIKDPPTEEEIIEFVKQGLSRFKTPKYVRFIDSYPIHRLM